LFAEGDYQPLQVEGKRSNHLCAFARHLGDEGIVVAVPRLLWGLYHSSSTADWGETELVLPSDGIWHDVFTGRKLVRRERVAVSELLADFPVCVLTGELIGKTAEANTADPRGWSRPATNI
jgi:(1->4)-alpha-D-glucan 1-alpha-D-glucosylmutase